MKLRMDIEKDLQESLIQKSVFSNTEWYNISWFGLVAYITFSCLSYTIGYALTRDLFDGPVHTGVRLFGDMVTVGWLATGIAVLPWHQWEEKTWIKTKTRIGILYILAWWSGTIITFFVYNSLLENTLFQTSLASDLTPDQRNVYIVTFSVIGAILIYWCVKMWRTTFRRRITFIRVLAVIAALFLISYIVCTADECTYHLHHWWFGFVLVLLSTFTMDNIFDYFLQGVFWAFLIESIFKYGFTFGRFFV